MVNFNVEGDQLMGATQVNWLKHRDQTISPRYVAIHYTAGGSLSGSIKHLRRVGYSYQLMIDRDGSVVQATPLTKRAAHAGISNWKGDESLNDYAIGISLANIGYLDRHGGKFYNLNRHGDLISPVFKAEDVVQSRHWNGHTGSRKMGWEPYTDAQYNSLRGVCAALLRAFPDIREAISHEAISVGRKPDPGMAFDWSRINDLFDEQPIEPGPQYRVVVSPNDNLNVRKGPNGSWGVKDKLANGARVHLRAYTYKYVGGHARKSDWASIALAGEHSHHGFVSTKYLRAA